MSFHSIVHDLSESLRSLSTKSFKIKLLALSGYHRRSQGSVHEEFDQSQIIESSPWSSLPPELLCDVLKRLEESESTWPSRRDVVAFAAVCRSWRQICKDIIRCPELCGKLTFPVSLKQPGPRDDMIQCFVKRDKLKHTYLLYLCLTTSVISVSGKFLLAAKRVRRTSYTEYIISMDAGNISESSCNYVGKMRSNFIGTKFVIYDTQRPYNAAKLVSRDRTSRRSYSKRVSPKLPSACYHIAEVTYEVNVLRNRGPRKMTCVMHSIPLTALEPGGTVPHQPKELLPSTVEESFRSTTSFSKSVMDHSMEFGSSHFCEVDREEPEVNGENDQKHAPLVLRNKAPRWHEQLQCWCLNFRGRVTVASVKNFQLIAAAQPANVGTPVDSMPSQSSQQSNTDRDKVILQFGKVAKDMFTMDYRYPLSAFQAFAICLTSFDTKLACE